MSKAKQHENPLENSVTRKQLKKLTAEWGELNVVERAVRLKALNERGCNDHELGRALKVDHKTGVDHKTISRYRRIAELPEEHREQIAQGASAAPFLKSQKNLQGRPEVARSGQPKTSNPHKPDAGKLIQESRPQPGLAAKQDQVEPLINEVQKLKKRLSAVEASQESIRRSLNEDAVSKALPGERKVTTKREVLGEVDCSPRRARQWPPELIKKNDDLEEKRKIVIPEKGWY